MRLNAGKCRLIERSADLTQRGNTLHKRLGTRPKAAPPPATAGATTAGWYAGKKNTCSSLENRQGHREVTDVAVPLEATGGSVLH